MTKYVFNDQASKKPEMPDMIDYRELPQLQIVPVEAPRTDTGKQDSVVRNNVRQNDTGFGRIKGENGFGRQKIGIS